MPSPTAPQTGGSLGNAGNDPHSQHGSSPAGLSRRWKAIKCQATARGFCDAYSIKNKHTTGLGQMGTRRPAEGAARQPQAEAMHSWRAFVWDSEARFEERLTCSAVLSS